MNPALLKLALAHRGAVLGERLRQHPDVSALLTPRPLALVPGESGEAPILAELVLPAEIVARVPLFASAPDASPFTLQGDPGDMLVIEDGSEKRSRIPVRLVPPPRFSTRSTSRGVPMHRIATVVGSYIAVHPWGACSIAMRGAPCSRCAGREPGPAESWHAAVDDVVETVRAAFDEGAAESVYLGTVLADGDDGGVAGLQPYVTAIRHHFDTLIAAELHPPVDDRWIDRTYAMGIDAVGYSVEVHDPEVFQSRFRGRARQIGRQRYHDALAYAASVFPRGTVWSTLVAGLETPTSTLAGIDAIVGLGAVPMLGMAGIAGRHDPDASALDARDLEPLGARLYRAPRERGLTIGHLRDLSTALAPLEARFFVGDDARLAVTMQQLARSRLGSLATRGLARFRRRLRVRAVRDSFDAAGL